jgi:uncharacterized protein YjbI with pentapeptide repeats
MHNLRFICLFLGLFLTACQDIRGITKQGGFRGEIRKGRSVVVSNRVIEGAVDFTALGEPVHAGINFSRVYLNGGVTFVNCRFKGGLIGFTGGGSESVTAVTFQKNLTFIQCIFESEVMFRSLEVEGQAIFSGCTFMANANFELADFRDEVIFSGSHFSGDVRFQNLFLRDKADFFKTEYAGSVNFQGSVFSREAQFGVTRCLRQADFSMVQFLGHAFFNYAACQDRITFENSTFRGRVSFIEARFSKMNCRKSWFWSIPEQEGMIVSDYLDTEGARWLMGLPDWGPGVRLGSN